MERRQMLKYLLAGGLSAGLFTPLWAQPGQPRPSGFPQPSAAGGSPPSQPAGKAQLEPDPEPIVVDPQELQRVLLDWEQKTARITKLRGEHERYEYDYAFEVEKRAVGTFWFESPDKGRIDFNVELQPQIPNPPTNPGKIGKSGNPFRIVAAEPTIWSCDGAMILSVNVNDRTYDKLEIPPHQRGENIVDGPLPFLFGMKADKLKARYRMTLGDKHNQPGRTGRMEYHVVASPLKQEDAREWKRAEVLLDAQYCLPTAIRLINPAETSETVYVFDLGKMKANEPKLHPAWLTNPFTPSLRGYKLLQSATRELDLRQR